MNNVAIVTGARGRLGRAFVARLLEAGFTVEGLDIGDVRRHRRALGQRVYLFDLAYTHGEPDAHIARVAAHLADWASWDGIFVPSSMWIVSDDAYGRAKQAVEDLAAFYAGQGAHVVTDRIGYFPGDGVMPDPTEPLYTHYVTGDALNARGMNRLLAQPVAMLQMAGQAA